MQKAQKGFTLIELIVVIVLLGILGVTALGKFQDLAGDAEQAAVEGIAAEISGASSINYAKSLLGTPVLGIGDTAAGGTNNMDTTANACLEAGGLELLMTGNSIPNINGTDVAIVAATNACTNPGDTYTCNFYFDEDADSTADANEAQATATIICTELIPRLR